MFLEHSSPPWEIFHHDRRPLWIKWGCPSFLSNNDERKPNVVFQGKEQTKLPFLLDIFWLSQFSYTCSSGTTSSLEVLEHCAYQLCPQSVPSGNTQWSPSRSVLHVKFRLFKVTTGIFLRHKCCWSSSDISHPSGGAEWCGKSIDMNSWHLYGGNWKVLWCWPETPYRSLRWSQSLSDQMWLAKLQPRSLGIPVFP